MMKPAASDKAPAASEACQVPLNSGAVIVDWDKFERRQRAEINGDDYKNKKGYAYQQARQRLAAGLLAKRRKERL